MSFSDIPVRSNGQTVTYAWFNTIRTYLVNFFGSSTISETQVSLSNNDGPTDVTGLSFDGTVIRTAKIEYQVYRKTDSLEYVESGIYIANYKTEAGEWYIEHMGAAGNSGTAITISTTTGIGQVQSTTDNMSGSNYSGYIRYKVMSTLSVES